MSTEPGETRRRGRAVGWLGLFALLAGCGDQVCSPWWLDNAAADPGDGWDRAYVYAFDTVRYHNQLRVYYNSRDGWKEGIERIGMASVELPCQPPSD